MVVVGVVVTVVAMVVVGAVMVVEGVVETVVEMVVVENIVEVDVGVVVPDAMHISSPFRVSPTISGSSEKWIRKSIVNSFPAYCSPL